MHLHIPGYDIIREARRGGQGVIFQALQRSTNRKVAVKVLLDGAMNDDKTVERFRREIEIVAGLRHPHIVAAFDSGVTDEGHLYFVMDFIYGQRLNEYVRSKKLDLTALLELFIGICDGVAYAHQRGIIHRDLKPANVIVDAEGRPRVLDFGLARRADERNLTVTSMGPGVLGTLAYMSPEQVRGRSIEVDIRTDVYSLGVMLYELIAGRFPYPVDDELAVVLENVAAAEPAPLAGVTVGGGKGGRISRDLETVVYKALAKDRDRRYQNAAELAADLRALLRGAPVSARRDSRMYVVMTTLRRHRGAVAAAVIFLLLIVSWAATLSVLYAREQALAREIQAEGLEAERQRERAIAAQATAQKRFEAVREMGTDLLFEAHDRVATLAGADQARALIITTALQFLDDLQRDAADNPSLLRDVATGFVRVGNMQAGLGDTDAALQSLGRARQICTEVLAKSPDDPAWQEILSDTRRQIDGVYATTGAPTRPGSSTDITP